MKKEVMTNKEMQFTKNISFSLFLNIGIVEVWWDGSYSWSVGMEGYRFFRKCRPGRQGGGVALYVNDDLECMELHLGVDEEPKES